MHARSGTFSLFASLLVVGAALGCSSSNDSTPPPVDDAGVMGGSDGATGVPDGGTSMSDGAAADSAASGDGGAASKTGDSANDGGPPPACSSLPGTLVYVESGDTQEPLLKTLGRQLRDDADITLVFELTGSCELTPNLYGATPIPRNTSMLYIPSAAENPSWTTADAESTCTTDPNDGTAPDLGISALFPSSCPSPAAPPSGVGSFVGPIQAYTFIVPTAEFGTQTAISAEEAYYALGDGANNPVTYDGSHEWNVPAAFFLRPAMKSTLVATALNVHLTAAQATLANPDGGTADGRILEASSDDVLSAVAQSTNAQALGILGDEIYDANRGMGVSVLAFQNFAQSAAYYPDSTTTSFDKQNIRDGHYTLWSPTVYIAPVTSSGVPSNPAVKYLVDLVLGNPGASPPGGVTDGGSPIDGLSAVVSVGLTPNCAMQVQRAGDGAPVTPYAPPAPCTCYFLGKVRNPGALPKSCVACSAGNPCATGSCFNGYCEVPPVPVTGGAPGCDVDDGGYGSLVNACTDATSIVKTGVSYPTTDGGLLPLNP